MNTLMQKRRVLKRRNAWTGLLVVALLVNLMFAMAPNSAVSDHVAQSVGAPLLQADADVSLQQFLPAAIR